MLPKGYLIGNLTSDPVSGTTNNSNNYTRFSIACNELYSKNNQPTKAHFYNCISWGNKAKFISTYIKKGNSVFVEYTLLTNSYTNPEGRIIRSMDLMVDTIMILQKKGDNNKDEISRETFNSGKSKTFDTETHPIQHLINNKVDKAGHEFSEIKDFSDINKELETESSISLDDIFDKND